MSDTTHTAGKSAEEVAYDLLKTIASNEEKTLRSTGTSTAKPASADRQWVLSTYAECLAVVRSAFYAKK